MRVVYFTSKTCSPCKTYGPLVQAVASEFAVETGMPVVIRTVSIDTPEGAAEARYYGVIQVPTIAPESDNPTIWASGPRTRKQVYRLFEDWAASPSDHNYSSTN